MSGKEIIADHVLGCFEKYSGQASEVQLVSTEENPLITIGSKAFLSCKTIERLYLPNTLERVEDWAFAHMKGLQEITLPAKEIYFGKKVFLGCDKLTMVYPADDSETGEKLHNIHPKSNIYEGIFYFLASSFRFFSGNNLDNLKMAGDEQKQWQWLADYDGVLRSFICKPDDYEFEPAFIGWFNVEDVDDQKQRFVLQQKKQKIRLAFQRLLYDERLTTEDRKFLQEYLVSRSELVEELLWDREEVCSSDVRYFRIWKQAGGLLSERIRVFLEKVSEDKPEIRAYLLKEQLENVEKNSFFNELDL